MPTPNPISGDRPEDEKIAIRIYNIEQLITENWQKRQKIQEIIGTNQKDIEAKLLSYNDSEKEHLDNVMALEIRLAKVRYAASKKTDEAVRNKANAFIKSLENEISGEKAAADLSRLRFVRDQEMGRRNFEIENRYRTVLGNIARNNFGVQVKEYDLVKSIGNELSKQPGLVGKLAYSIGAVVMILSHAFKLFNDFDKAAAKFRMDMGFTRDTARQVRTQAERMAIDFMHVGVTIDGAYESISALGTELGSIHGISKDLAINTALLASQYGIAEADTAGVLRNFSAIAKTSMEAQQNTVLFGASLAQASGVSLPQVMKDVAHMSSVSLTMISKIPNQIIKSAIEARRMNTTIDGMGNSSRTLLNFSQNIQDEMEASVLLGKSINLQKARELAYQGKLVESTNAVLDIADQIDFTHLDVFQMESFAKASGRSVEELNKMLAARQQQQALEKSTDPIIQQQLATLKKLKNASQDVVLSEIEKQKIFLRQESNQTRLAAISQKWNQILSQAAEVLLPVVDLILTAIPPALDLARSFFGMFGTLLVIEKTMMTISGTLFSWLGTGSKVATFFGKIGMFVGTLARPFVFISEILAKWTPMVLKFLGPLGKIVSPFLKILGPIGWVITAFQAISGFIRGWKEGGTFMEKLVGGLKGAFISIIPFGDKILKVFGWIFNFLTKNPLMKWLSPLGQIGILSGFIGKHWDKIVSILKMGWGWISKTWGILKSIGSGILESIKLVAGAIFDAFISPFKLGFKWIMDKIPGGSFIADKLFGAGTGPGKPASSSVESKASAAYVTAAKVTPEGIRLAGTDKEKTDTVKAVKSGEMAEPMSEDTGQKMVALLEQILKKDTSVHMDGQLLGATLARSQAFGGGFGVNKV